MNPCNENKTRSHESCKTCNVLWNYKWSVCNRSTRWCNYEFIKQNDWTCTQKVVVESWGVTPHLHPYPTTNMKLVTGCMQGVFSVAPSCYPSQRFGHTASMQAKNSRKGFNPITKQKATSNYTSFLFPCNQKNSNKEPEGSFLCPLSDPEQPEWKRKQRCYEPVFAPLHLQATIKAPTCPCAARTIADTTWCRAPQLRRLNVVQPQLPRGKGSAPVSSG